MEIGKRLYELRKAKGLSQEEVAARLSVTRQTVSKWETGQSTPDFDKVLPLCRLYDISTEELFSGELPQRKPSATEDVLQPAPTASLDEDQEAVRRRFREKSAKVVSIAVFLYVTAVVFLMIAIPVLYLNPVVASGIFLLICAFATAMIIRHYMTKPKFASAQPIKKEKSLKKQIKSVIGIAVLAIYLLLSFLTMAWHITWILWVVYGLICEVITLIFMIKDGKQHEE